MIILFPRYSPFTIHHSPFTTHYSLQSKNNDLATGSTQKASAAGGAHALSGVVGKRNKAFKNAMRKKLGWKKDASGLSESLA
jgi:hypothetical protein